MTKPETIERREKRQRAAEAAQPTCPVCGKVPPALLVRTLTICSCLASLVIDAEGCRRARGEDTTVLSDAELATLRQARKRLREAA